jgi:aspartate racemase
MHKTIGIVGGMSHESTVAYYEHIHRTYYERFKRIDYPAVVIYSVPFSECVRWTKTDSWDEAAKALLQAVKSLHAAGADFALIATNTMHIVFDKVAGDSPVPLLNIIDVTAKAVRERRLQNVGLIGTAKTMEHPFYRERLEQNGLTALVPDKKDRDLIERVIYDELTAGKILPESRDAFLAVIQRLGDRGAQAIILGCTEIPLLVSQKDTGLPLFDTTRIHAEAALELALDPEQIESKETA